MAASARQHILRDNCRIGVQPVDDRHSGREFHRRDGLGRQPVQHHHERPQAVAVRSDKDVLAAQNLRQDALTIIGKRARDRVLQAFAVGRRDVIAATPQVNLLLAPLLAGVVLIQAAEIAVVALVQCLVAMIRQAGLTHRAKGQGERMLGPGQRRGEREVEGDSMRLETPPRFRRLLDSGRSEVRIAPAGEQVLQIPFALTMP